MELSSERIKGLMAVVFDKAYHASPELKPTILDEVLSQFVASETNASRVYKVAELQAMPIGTMFEHSVRGRCWIMAKADGKKTVHFQNGGTMNILQDEDPWNKSMRVIYTPKG